MMFSGFLRRFLWHVSAAAVVLFVVLILGEYFVPGSVLPFVDLIDAAMAIVGWLVVSVLISPRDTET